MSGRLGNMTLAEFEELVRRALEELPKEISARMENIDLVVEDWPTRNQLVGSGIEEDNYLLGLYEGVPLPDRYDYGMVLPDKITLFQRAIEAICDSDEEIVREVRDTVVHEVGHHFGIDDPTLEEMGV